MTGRLWKRFLARKGPAMGFVILAVVILSVVLADLVSPHSPVEIDLDSSLQPPSASHPFGTDAFGRDVLTRVLHGGRVSIGIGLAARALSLLLGLIAGTVAGYSGSKIDSLLMRLADVTFAFPTLLLLIAIMAVVTPGIWALCLALGVVGWAAMARLVRAQVISVRERAYVQAARAAGAGHLKLIARYILPQVASPLIVVFTLGLGMTIMAESSLSFLGLGIPPPSPSWGGMISAGIPFMRSAPWLTFFPGLVLTLTICSINLVGDGLRDAIDPRMVIPRQGIRSDNGLARRKLHGRRGNG
jgi:ABC-type dipeptide/oligopeptide/nickel transport system permease subunit